MLRHMAPSADEKLLPSSPPASKASPSTLRQIGAKLNTWPAHIRTHYRPSLWPAYRQRLKHSKAPILVGPFLGEVGLETLYWEPFVSQVRHELGIPAERMIPLTRSAAHVWYGCPKALEIYGMRDVRDVRIENRLRVARSGMLKQMTVTPFDRQIYRDAAQTLGLTDYLTLHPAWMYQTLQPFWMGERGLSWVEPRIKLAPLPRPELPMDLPEKYVAVAFYARSTWEASAMTASFARETIALIAKSIPVVLLSTSLHMDDHLDYIPKPLPEHVSVLADTFACTPQNSLAAIAAVMGKATAFVGTYGGLSHMALRYGVPSVNLYTKWQGIMLAHKTLSEALALQIGVPYHVVQLGQIPILQDVLPRVVQQQRGSSQKVVAPEPAMV
jgi:hypothetical protein